MSDRPILDQAAHVVAGMVALVPAALWPGVVTFALAGAVIGFVREITHGGSIVTAERLREAIDRRSMFDILFWTLGGAFAGLIGSL